MMSLVLYFFLATMMGIIQIGVGFLWLTLYRIKKFSTAPQGLLICSILLSFGLLAFNYSITSVVAPGYAHFGSQVYVSLFFLINCYCLFLINSLCINNTV